MSANAMFYRYPSSTTYNFIYARRKRLRLWKILVLVSVLVPDLNLASSSRSTSSGGIVVMIIMMMMMMMMMMIKVVVLILIMII